MPFGSQCEFPDMDACIRHYKGKKSDPAGYCATIMRATEEHCKSRAAQHVPADPPPVAIERSELPPAVDA